MNLTDLTPDQLRALRKRVGDAGREKVDREIARRALAVLDEAERWTRTFVLPLPPNMANARRHWTATLRQKNDYYARCDAMALALPKPPTKPHDCVRMSVTLYVWSMMDPDGAVSRCKWPIDWLVKAGYVVDDKGRNIEWAGMPTQVIDRKAQRLEITIEPIAESEAA